MPENNDQQQPQNQAVPDPFTDLFYKIDATLKYLDKISDKPEEYRQAALDALVTDLMPGMQRLAAGMGRFVSDTIGIVQDIDGRLTAAEQHVGEVSDRVDAIEDPGSTLLAEDAELLSKFVVASLGVISKMPTTDPSRQPMLDLGKQALDIINEAKLEEESDEDGDDAGDE